MNAAWIMFFSKREKVGSQELSIEIDCVSGKLSYLAVDQKRIGCYTDIILYEISIIVCSRILLKNIAVFLPEQPVFQGKTTTFV